MKRSTYHLLTYFLLFSKYCISYGSGSYLQLPRISFTGQVRIDVNTRNNNNCRFDLKYNETIPIAKDFNPNGTSEFSFFNCSITSVAYRDGTVSTTDDFVGSKVTNNIDQSYPKIVDLDVDYQLIRAGVYGMNLTVVSKSGKIALAGELQQNVLAQDLWSRVLCKSDLLNSVNQSHYFASKLVSRLDRVMWGDASSHPILAQLKQTADMNGGDLSVTMSLYFYTRDVSFSLYKNFTLAYVIGTIGVARDNPKEPLNFAGNRLLSFRERSPITLPLTPDDSCYEYQNTGNDLVWAYKAPFQFDTVNSMLTFDFSNSFSLNPYGSLRDLGVLRVGVLDEAQVCFNLIGDPLPYLHTDWNAKGAIFDVHITNSTIVGMLNSSKVALLRYRTDPVHEETIIHPTIDVFKVGSARSSYYRSCSDNQGALYWQALLMEDRLFIRTMDHYVGRLEYQKSMNIAVLLTEFGNPVKGANVTVYLSNKCVLPTEGVFPSTQTAITDDNGIATITFVANYTGQNRQYYSPDECPSDDCTSCNSCNLTELPIEGQVYMFKYYAAGTAQYDYTNNVTSLTSVNDIAILAFSNYSVTPPFTWVEHIEHIFSQYQRLYPVMKPIVALGNYTDVTKEHNRNLLLYAMQLDINHPSYMPVTRDLSPPKRQMIIEWLKNPKYSKHEPKLSVNDSVIDDSCVHPTTLTAISLADSYFFPPWCHQQVGGHSNRLEPFITYHGDSFDHYFDDIFDSTPGHSYHFDDETQCSVESLKADLQTAVELEFSTIPLYLTSLYSIVEGCNKEIYHLIRSIVMQEMLHMVQAANILIAIGGNPVIDSDKAVPSYPRKGLPGNVLPRLRVTLEKLTLKHVFEVFMAVEVPQHVTPNITINNTIGQFYRSINGCINLLGNEIFLPNTSHRQMQWPFSTKIGKVYTVTDVHNASLAINEIVEQGEGAKPFDPTQGGIIPIKIAHFYKFAEIVCQRRLIKNEDGHYYFNGAPITYDPLGVWQMKANPSKNDIPPRNNCFTEARAFHGVYRALLRKIQEAFSGNVDPADAMKEAVSLMESLSVHARKLMWTKISPEFDTSCGPIWDYNWDG